MRTMVPMCYSAQLQAAYLKYLRETGAQMDIDQFVEIFGARITDSSIRIPRAIERWFDEPKNDGERKIKGFIDQWRSAEITKLEREVFAQKKRLADAERTLASKITKAATESQRIATNKIEQALTRLDRMKAVQPHPAEARIFPLHFAPIVMQVGDRRLMRLARYHCRLPGEQPFIDFMATVGYYAMLAVVGWLADWPVEGSCFQVANPLTHATTSVIPTERKSQESSVHLRMAWSQPVSSFPEISAAIAKANGIVMLM